MFIRMPVWNPVLKSCFTHYAELDDEDEVGEVISVNDMFSHEEK